MSQGLVPIYHKRNWYAGGALASTTTSSALEMYVGECYQLVLDITSVTGTSPTLDIVLQTSFNGSAGTYVNLPIRSSQITAARVEYLTFKLGLGDSEVALSQVVADTGGILTKNCLFDPAAIKVKSTIGGTNPSFTVNIHLSVLGTGFERS